MSSSPQLVSVVIPVGSVDDLLPLQLAALEAQTFDGAWELVLSCKTDDGAAIDALDGLASSFDAAPARVVDSSDVRSASHARNVGAREAQGELIVFCDGDDEAETDWLASIVAAAPFMVLGVCTRAHCGGTTSLAPTAERARKSTPCSFYHKIRREAAFSVANNG